MTLAGRIALVTGGSRGIGAATALALAGQGADVAITYAASADKAEAVVERIRAMGRRASAIRADAAQPSAVADAVDQVAGTMGGLTVLVNNAGVFPFGPPEAVSREELDRTVAIHTTSVFVASQRALAHMGAGGRIISIGSCLAQRVTGPGMTLYAMSKAALGGFTRGLARDVGPRGITVNLIEPGPIDTDMNPADSEMADEERRLIALGAFGRPEDVAATVVHLAGEAGRYITGAAIAVDGGTNA